MAIETHRDTRELPEDVRRVHEQPVIAYLATVDPDGSPQVTPVWVDVEDGRIVFNTAEGRVKHRNMQRDPRVTLAAHHPDDVYDWVSIQGTVTMTTEGGDAHIDRLAKKYLGKDRYPWHKATETRVRVFLEPLRIVSS